MNAKILYCTVGLQRCWRHIIIKYILQQNGFNVLDQHNQFLSVMICISFKLLPDNYSHLQCKQHLRNTVSFFIPFFFVCTNEIWTRIQYVLLVDNLLIIIIMPPQVVVVLQIEYSCCEIFGNLLGLLTASKG